MDYYDKFSREYFEATLNLEMSHFYDPFLKLIHKNARILDIGCGSGRDIKYFMSLGHVVCGVDPSLEMIKLARENTKTEIIHGSIQEVDFQKTFDAVWACASLLHIPSNELDYVFEKISKILSPGGIFYCSFKNGDFEGFAEYGRYFTFLTEDKLTNHLNSISDFEIKKIWISADIRSDKDVTWINCIAIKNP